MKFKKLILGLLSVLFVTSLSSCSDELENVVPEPTDTVVLNTGLGDEGEIIERD